jgi:hydroxymethylpyrimidine pyrophosphatase-like HAD family hydrolase
MFALESNPGHKFHVMFQLKGKPQDKIIIFDLDDTLVRTPAKVKILDRKTHEILSELTPQEFNEFEKKDWHSINFDQFDCPEILRQGKMIHEVFEILKEAYRNKIAVAIVTARGDSNLVRQFFLEREIDIHPELVIAINDPSFMFEGTIPEKKMKAIEKLIDMGFTDMIFFDDHEDNLALAKIAAGLKSATIKTIKV